MADFATLGVAVVALLVSAWLGAWSVRTARGANELSRQAVAAANEANSLAAKSDERDRERHDVRWRSDRPEGSLEWWLWNDGIDIARKVTLIVDAGAGDVVMEGIDVQPNTHLTVATPHEAERQEESRREKDRWRNSASDGIIWIPRSYTPTKVRYRVYWQSNLGALRSEEFDPKGKKP